MRLANELSSSDTLKNGQTLVKSIYETEIRASSADFFVL